MPTPGGSGCQTGAPLRRYGLASIAELSPYGGPSAEIRYGGRRKQESERSGRACTCLHLSPERKRVLTAYVTCRPGRGTRHISLVIACA